MTKKQFHLKIKWKNREKTEPYEIVLYDSGQPLCELISVDDARLIRDILNEQEERIQELTSALKELKEIGDYQAMIIKELEEENGRMKEAFKRKFDYDIEDVVDEICDEDW